MAKIKSNEEESDAEEPAVQDQVEAAEAGEAADGAKAEEGREEAVAAQYPCPECAHVAASASALSAHQSRHDKEEISFTSERFPNLVIAPGGKTVAKFVGGKLTTTDRTAVRICREHPHVEEVT